MRVATGLLLGYAADRLLGEAGLGAAVEEVEAAIIQIIRQYGRKHDFMIAGSGVASLGLGEADLRSALGVGSSADLGWQRARVVNAAAAAGLTPPAMSVYAQVSDADGLAASCRTGRAAGFLGRAAIHPRQLPVIVAAFLPTPEETARARGIVDGFAAANEAGGGTFVMPDGTFIDVAMIRAARRTLELGERADA